MKHVQQKNEKFTVLLLVTNSLKRTVHKDSLLQKHLHLQYMFLKNNKQKTYTIKIQKNYIMVFVIIITTMIRRMGLIKLMEVGNKYRTVQCT